MPRPTRRGAKVAPLPVHASLAHLRPCPDCGFRTGAALMSEGISNEENADCWYETCLNNRPPRYSTCDYFAWREDIPEGRPAIPEPRACPGLLCTSRADAGKNRKMVNGECTFGVCKSCCRDIQSNVSPPRWCKISDHSTGVVRPAMLPAHALTAASSDHEMEALDPGVESTHGPVTRRGRRGRPARVQGQGRGRGTTTVQRGRQAASQPAGRGQVGSAQQSSRSAASSRHRTANDNPLAQIDPDLYADRSDDPPALDTSRPSVALSIGPYYQATLTASEQQQRLQAELAETEARHERARAKRHETSLRWWNENDELPQSLVVPVPKWPEFHPPDIPLLVQEFLGANGRFQYWESKDRTWFTGSTGTTPRDLRKLTKDDLCYRSWDIKRGIGMPGAQVKRPSPETYDPADVLHDGSGASYLTTPRRHFRFSSPAPTSPPGSGSSAVSWFDETDTLTRPASGSEAIDPDTTITQDSDSQLPQCLDDPLAGILVSQTSYTAPQAPLPALFPSDSTAPAPAITSAPSASVLDLSSAPRGPRTWPWRYVCDMAAGFDAMRVLQDANPKMPRDEVFAEVFRHTYKVSTYNEQFRAWRAAGKNPGERERWIAAGRSDRGEWSEFMRMWRGKK